MYPNGRFGYVLLLMCTRNDGFGVHIRGLPAGPYVTDDDVRYIVDCIKEATSCDE